MNITTMEKVVEEEEDDDDSYDKADFVVSSNVPIEPTPHTDEVEDTGLIEGTTATQEDKLSNEMAILRNELEEITMKYKSMKAEVGRLNAIFMQADEWTAKVSKDYEELQHQYQADTGKLKSEIDRLQGENKDLMQRLATPATAISAAGTGARAQHGGSFFSDVVDHHVAGDLPSDHAKGMKKTESFLLGDRKDVTIEEVKSKLSDLETELLLTKKENITLKVRRLSTDEGAHRGRRTSSIGHHHGHGEHGRKSGYSNFLALAILALSLFYGALSLLFPPAESPTEGSISDGTQSSKQD